MYFIDLELLSFYRCRSRNIFTTKIKDMIRGEEMREILY